MSLISINSESREAPTSLEMLQRFFVGYFYPPLVALAVILGYVTSQPLAFFVVMMLSLSFALTICDSIRPLIMPLFSVVFIVNPEHGNMFTDFSGYLTTGYNMLIFASTVAVFVICTLSFVFRNVAFRASIESAPILIPTALFAVVLILNGVFGGSWSVSNLILGVIEAATFFLLFYLIYFGLLEDDTEGVINYVIFCCALTVVVLSVNVLYFFMTTPEAFNADGAIMKEKLEFGFGISNSLGFAASAFLPACVFGINRAPRISYRIFYFVTAIAAYALVVVSLCRNAFLFSTAALVLSFVICSFFGEGRRACRVIVVLGVIATCVFLIAYWDDVIRITTEYINRNTNDSGRFKLWSYAYEVFLKSPIFGEGFFSMEEYTVNDPYDFMPVMAHNTPLQMLVACGVVGLAVYCIYRIATLLPLFKNLSFTKIMLSAPVFITIAESWLDNFIFYIYMAFPYLVFLAILHKMKNEEERAL